MPKNKIKLLFIVIVILVVFSFWQWLQLKTRENSYQKLKVKEKKFLAMAREVKAESSRLKSMIVKSQGKTLLELLNYVLKKKGITDKVVYIKSLPEKRSETLIREEASLKIANIDFSLLLELFSLFQEERIWIDNIEMTKEEGDVFSLDLRVFILKNG